MADEASVLQVFSCKLGLRGAPCARGRLIHCTLIAAIEQTTGSGWEVVHLTCKAGMLSGRRSLSSDRWIFP